MGAAVRVVAGRWRGHPLRTLAGQDVRPTADRVREALFSILGDAVADAEVADLCCGSGALGIEALSRGAARATLVDLSAAALTIVRANLARLDVPAAQAAAVRAEAVAWLRRRLASAEPLLVLADPPYASGVGQALLATILAAPPTARIPVAVIEHDADHLLDIPPTSRWRAEVRRYGRSGLTILWQEAP